MQDLTQFVNKWNGQYFPPEPGISGHQCVVVDKTWERANGWNPVTHGNAIDYMKGETNYQVIWNTPSGIPHPGDIAVIQVGRYGHTGVVVSADINRVTILNQNYPIGHPACITTFGYATRFNKENRVIGWLHHNG